MGRLIGYVRVSTEEQNLARQLEAMGEVDVLYQDKMSGKNVNRVGLQKMFSEVQEGDTIRVKSIDRLARSTRDLLSILDDMENRGVKVEFIDTPYLNTSSKEGRFFVTILGALAEMERITIRERQAEGIAIAKAAGKYKKFLKFTVEQAAEIRRLYDEGESTKALASKFGSSKATILKVLHGRRVYGEGEYADIPPVKRELQKPKQRMSEDSESIAIRVFTPEEVAEIRLRVSRGEYQTVIAREFDVTNHTIKKVICGEGRYGKDEYAHIPTIKPHKGRATVEQVIEIRERVADGETQKALCEEFDINCETMRQIVKGLGTYGKGEYAEIPVLGVPKTRKTNAAKKLSVEDVVKVRRLYSQGKSIDSLCKRFNTSKMTMYNAVFGKYTYSHGDYAYIPVPAKKSA